MFQEFNKVTTTSNFIKNLLISTYLPLIRTVRDFDYIIVDRLYVYKCEIIKCTKSGYLVTGYKNLKFDGERASYRVVSEYYFGEKNDKLCTNYVSNSEGYDSITHERLGKYLRSLRDMYDLNLMPLYNCFSNNILQAHHISNEKVEKTAYEYNTKIYKVPIRFNTDYTICMDNLGVTTFAPAFIKNNNLVLLNNTRFGNGTDATNKYIKLHRTNVIYNKSNLRFKSPFVIRFNNVPERKVVKYFERMPQKIDYLHNNNLFSENTPTTLPRNKYYIRNIGDYSIIDITDEEFNKNKTNYYYSDNGIITQCSLSDEFSVDTIYFILNTNSTQNTYLPTSLTPSTAGNNILYIGTEPKTGRVDSTYYSEGDASFYIVPGDDSTIFSRNIEIDEQNSTLYMDENKVSIEYRDNNAIYLSVTSKQQVYDSPNFNIVTLWHWCSKDHQYSTSETYYVRSNDEFIVWEYELGEEAFNEQKTFYYYKSGDEYIQCQETDVYDENTTYYVFVNENYITAEEYYFSTHSTEFALADGFESSPSNYYQFDSASNAFIHLTDAAEFDINNTYAEIIEKEQFTWREKDGNGNLIPSQDEYIVTGKEYYSKYDVETEANYVYDITEENCALYDYVEDNLYLLIQVPKSYESSIVVLEGNYTNTQSEKIIDDSEVERLPEPLIDYLYTSNLKLMEMPSSVPVPFSDALMEFLLWNAINNLDSINNNMDRLLYAIGRVLQNPFDVYHYANYWYAQYRKLVSDIGRNYNNMVVTDNLGYVTKNLEQVINTSSYGDSLTLYD